MASPAAHFAGAHRTALDLDRRLQGGDVLAHKIQTAMQRACDDRRARQPYALKKDQEANCNCGQITENPSARAAARQQATARSPILNTSRVSPLYLKSGSSRRPA
jgi:hypothetical protein